jgi:radical SAM-linked protein
MMYHYRICFAKTGWLKYISHLDLQRTFQRIFRRAQVPLAYKKGFNPQPQFSFASPLAVGIEGQNEYLDFFLEKSWEETALKEAINEQCPPGIVIKKVIAVDLKLPPISSLLEAALYVIPLIKFPEKMDEKIKNIIAAENIIIERKSKRRNKNVNIRPFIFDLRILEVEDPEKVAAGEVAGKLIMLLATGNKGGIRPDEIVDLLGLEKEHFKKIYRQELFINGKGGLENPLGINYEEYMKKWMNYEV